MRLKPVDVEKLERFLRKIAAETYPEPIGNLHAQIAEGMLQKFTDKYVLPAAARVLDVGCGQGVALRHFIARGWQATGITLNAEDVAACQALGFDVQQMDQSFLDFTDATFDFVWCRHCLEHSIFPYFTLSEFFRVLKPGGYLYVEVPAPDTSCGHQTNRNHYSVMGKSMWLSLMERAGFAVQEVFDISFQVMAGPDIYWSVIQRKPTSA